jgi:hypothetical protein
LLLLPLLAGQAVAVVTDAVDTDVSYEQVTYTDADAVNMPDTGPDPTVLPAMAVDRPSRENTITLNIEDSGAAASGQGGERNTLRDIATASGSWLLPTSTTKYSEILEVSPSCSRPAYSPQL